MNSHARATNRGLLWVSLMAVVAIASISLGAAIGEYTSASPVQAASAPVRSQTALSASAQASGGAPSEAAAMICAPQTRAAVQAALKLDDQPSPTARWADHVYTCTYNLADGPLVLSVRELPDLSTAESSFTELSAQTRGAEAIIGLASLGFPGFTTTSGTVSFQKDNMILVVDATNLRAQIGPNEVGRTDFAYQIATNVLACWKAHHSAD